MREHRCAGWYLGNPHELSYSFCMLEHVLITKEVVFLAGLGASLLAGFAIGLERESRHKDAGISTHTLVIMGSMLFTFLSSQVDSESTSRIAAQIVTGIGFLGAGLILKEGTTVRNLTTAASLWFSAAIGMSFGFGYYTVGILATLAAVAVPRIPHVMDYHSSGDRDNTPGQ
jgi:putative Mg2+ transporter-C (MgtC) family protein